MANKKKPDTIDKLESLIEKVEKKQADPVKKLEDLIEDEMLESSASVDVKLDTAEKKKRKKARFNTGATPLTETTFKVPSAMLNRDSQDHISALSASRIQEESKSDNTMLIIIVIVVALAISAGIAAYFFLF